MGILHVCRSGYESVNGSLMEQEHIQESTETAAGVSPRKRDAKDQIREKLPYVPQKPGVYLMRDRFGKIIYVGKAKLLRNRVRTYFQPGADDGRRQFKALVSNIADFEYIITDTEAEALILEANLIKEHKPRYNISLKDDRKYPFIKITKEPFPQLVVVRNLKRDGARYFGPYTDVRAMRRTLETLRRILPIRSCTHALPSPRIKRTCLDYEIRRCAGPCVGLISEKEYRKTMDQAILFLNGRSNELATALRGRMEEAAGALKFEEAAAYRDRLADLERTTARQKVVSGSLIDWDAMAIAREDDEACGLVLEVRGGRLLGRKEYFLGGVIDATTPEVVSAFVRQFYLSAMFVPQEVHLPCRIEDQEVFRKWLSGRAGERVIVRVPKRGDKAKLIAMAAENAEVLLLERRQKREKLRDRVPHVIEALQRDLRLEGPPRRIEAVDISNIGGLDAVGSLVSFVDGKPKKGEYRRFKIASVEGQDDFAMMREVVTRRFRRLLEEEGTFPDLLLVDGGKGQLSSARAALHELGLDDQPVIGLAKRLEEVFVPGRSDPVMIPKVSSSLRLLQMIRDEAHRFAVEYHRKLREKRTISSVLDEIPGVGKARRTSLLQTFGSVTRIADAKVEEIAAVEGIGSKLAEKIKSELSSVGRRA